jgi:hypothetical protein
MTVRAYKKQDDKQQDLDITKDDQQQASEGGDNAVPQW